MDVTRCGHGLFMYYSSTSLGRHYVWISVLFCKTSMTIKHKANTTIRSNEKENRTCCVYTTLLLSSQLVFQSKFW